MPFGSPVKIDLLSITDADQDAIAGKWSIQDDKLTSSSDRHARICIPLRPPSEYDLNIVAERITGSAELTIGLVVGQSQFAAILDGWQSTSSGLGLLDGEPANKNSTTFEGSVFTNGQPSEIAIQVRTAGVSVTVDGKSVIDWKGNPNRLSLHKDWSVGDASALFIGSLASEYRIHSMTLTPVTGEAERIRK